MKDEFSDRNNSPENKRLHVYFNHGGISFRFLLPSQKRPVEQLLKTVWSQFGGTVTHQYYHNEFSFGFVSYANHDQAEWALNGMKYTSALKPAVAVAVSKSSNPILPKYIAGELFIFGRGGGSSLISPSWATPPNKKV